MATIDELKPEQFRNPEIFEKIKELADSFIFYLQIKEAYFLQQKLTPILEASNIKSLDPDLNKNYQNLIAQLKWTALLMLPDEEALKLLRENYLEVLENENINIIDRIEAKMFSKGLFPRDEFRQKMQVALRENKEQLGNKTFGEWLFDFNKTFDFRERDELSYSKYLNQNPEAQTLSEPEKNKLRKALQIFDKTLLVTPVMDEPELSIYIMAMIKRGIIDKTSIDPALLQTISITARTAAKTATAAPIVHAPMRPAPAPIRPATVRPIPSVPVRPVPISTPIAKEEVKEVKEKPTGLFEKMFGEPDKSARRILTGPPASQRGEPESESFGGKIQKITEPAPQPAPLSPTQGGYRIRTMKQDIEKTKRQPIPKKPEPKIHDNIVDLSGK